MEISDIVLWHKENKGRCVGDIDETRKFFNKVFDNVLEFLSVEVGQTLFGRRPEVAEILNAKLGKLEYWFNANKNRGTRDLKRFQLFYDDAFTKVFDYMKEIQRYAER